jgi:Mn-dependent DtxR family transcriptional regulator
MKMAENENVGSIRFSAKQIAFFLGKPHFFHFFMKLAYERKSPQDIQKEFNLSAKSMSLYLKKLEEIDLIRRHPRDHNQIIGGIPIGIDTKGTELEILKHRIATKLLSGLQGQESSQLKGAGLFLSKEQSETFRERIEATLLDYSSLSRSNRKKTSKSNFSDLTFMSFVTNSSLFNDVIEL